MLRPLLFLFAVFSSSGVAALSGDAWFLQARDAYRASSESRLNQAVANLNGHPLESYARYWQLRLNLDRASAGEVSEFLSRFEQQFIAEQLRKDWLRVLGKRQQWELFQAVWTGAGAEEPDLACYRAQAQWRQGDKSGVTAARVAWDAPREIPEGCVPVLEAELAAGLIDNEQIWRRIRSLNEAGQNGAVERAANYLPAAETPDEKQRDAIARNPQRYLERVEKVDLRKRPNRELTIYALQRAALADPEATVLRWDDKLRAAFTPEDRAYVWGQFALIAAKKHLPQALNWFDAAEGAPLNGEQLQWWTRAALRAGDWSKVRTAIERMPEALRNEPTWTYWLARALAARGERERATPLYNQIAASPQFYGKLAQEELGYPLSIPQTGFTPAAEDVDAAAANPGVQRAIALFQADMWLEGVREWNWTIRGMDDRQLLATAEVARRNQLWDRAINTADRTVALHDYALRYLSPYRGHFAERAREQGLEEPWVLGLVRQESRFVAHARSSAGAQGLMQVMPATARWVAKRMGMSSYNARQIAEVETNIALGTGYLRYVLDQLEASPVLAAAAYNAGPGRARRWKAEVPLEGAIYAESIPFSETRDYVKKVMINTVYYAALHGGEQRSLRERLGVIPSRQGGESYAPTITGEATVQ